MMKGEANMQAFPGIHLYLHRTAYVHVYNQILKKQAE